MRLIVCLCILMLFSCKPTKTAIKAGKITGKKTSNVIHTKKHEGFIDFSFNEKSGKIFLEIENLDQEFLYVNSLPAGVGSNDIGLDRGQLGGRKIVKFSHVGDKILMIQPNYDYRAISDNPAESESVKQAFAESVIWGFKLENRIGNKLVVDATDFLLRDAHGVVNRLKQRKQGSYRLDKSRSAIYVPMCKNFPKNTEFEATVTFTGTPAGGYIRSVTPSADAITVRMHHSFIELPDDNYQPRMFDPRSGFNGIRFADYATPIDQSLFKRFINRHRLEKKDPSAAISEAVEPIIYYVDKGAPEPILSALIEGASWWNQAFEAAGYKNAFQVKVMPPEADPMDIRYNVIQWVHRSTRGWSYGASVADPRTGEILKGHVSLGSLRVRQDFLIAQGLVKAYEEGKPVSPKMLEMALARLRQLSAHEVGHTIGLAHNFAASANDRSSVMDYPHPYITMNENGTLNFEAAYDDKIGAWDKRTILFGYQDFPEGTDEEKALLEILKENDRLGLRYISDADARPAGSAHPYAHLWDNGANPVDELNRLMAMRSKALQNFSIENISMNTPMSSLEEVLVPLYLAHRYQVEAAAKMIGGVDYQYGTRGNNLSNSAKIVPSDVQMQAMTAVLKTLNPKELAISENILKLIPPKAFAYSRGRESFKTRTGLTFDPVAAAESAANHTLKFYLHPHRATRLIEHHARDKRNPGLHNVVNALLEATWFTKEADSYEAEIGRMVDKLVLTHLMKLAMSTNASDQARAISWLKINELEKWLNKQSASQDIDKAHYSHGLFLIKKFKDDPEEWLNSQPLEMPDGSPIGMEAMGCGEQH